MFQNARKQVMPQGTIMLFDILASQIVHKNHAGQFVILRVNEIGEQIPLAVADKNKFLGNISDIFQFVGKAKALMRWLKEGDTIKDVPEPLVKPAEIQKEESVIMMGSGRIAKHAMHEKLSKKNN